MSGGMIAQGRFEVPRKDGPVPGNYVVVIFAAQENPNSASANEVMPGSEPRAPRSKEPVIIPSRYNVESELKAQVKSGGPNAFAFNLQK